MKRSLFLGAALLALGLGATASLADLGDDREAAMKQVRAGYRDLLNMAKADAFEAATAQAGAARILAALDAFKELFPKGSEHADKAASPDIWSDRAGFDATWKAARDAASQVAAVTDAAGYRPAFDKLAAACKSCHTKFVQED